jgi:lysozyme family protein
MLSINSNIFNEYANHVLDVEGGKTSNVKDTTAAKQVAAGQVHTNRGITWNVYQALASKLGLQNDYNSFLNLTKDQAKKFIYQYYLDNAKDLPDQTAMAVTESAWASGPSQAANNLIHALTKLGYPTKTRKAAALIASKVNDKDLAIAVAKEQQLKYETLAKLNPGKYGDFLKGWTNRTNKLLATIQKFKPSVFGLSTIVIIAAVFFLIRKKG